MKLDLVTGDDKADPKDGTLVAQKMIDEGVVALVGHLNSGTTIPASKLYSDANLSHISPSATAVKLTEQGFKTTFRVVARDDKQGAALANFASGPLKAKTVAVIDDRTPYGQGLADEFEKFAKEKGMKVVGREFTNDKASDFNAILTSALGEAEVVMSAAWTHTGRWPSHIALGMNRRCSQAPVLCRPIPHSAGNSATHEFSNSGSRPNPPKRRGLCRQDKNVHTEVQVYSPYSYDASIDRGSDEEGRQG